ncbi:Cysteine protease, C1A family [Lachnospiraceae bacterium A10]|nr:Cysteine protease, C1A family [Lachnospiraceae bacterium A10]
MRGKKYIAFTLVILIFILGELNTWNDEYAQVESFRGASLNQELFHPLIAANVNETGAMTLSIDGSSYRNQGDGLYLDESLHVLAELSYIRDIFACSARGTDESKIVLKRNGTSYTFKVDATEYAVDGKIAEDGSTVLNTTPRYMNESYYLPLEDIAHLFSFGFSFDTQTYAVSLDSTLATASKLPTSYDLRDEDRVSEIKDQGSQSTCWAYAAVGALESSCLPEENLNFSADDVVSNNNYNRTAEDGGDYRVAASYFLSWNGPVTEGSETSESVGKHVQELHFYTEDDIDDIKWAVYKDGGVSTSIYVDVSTDTLTGSSYYNKSENAYCYRGNNSPNHDVVIIGWDDDYDKSNFANSVRGNGAFICQNSWGTDFGEDGVFYVSYYDTNIGKAAVSYVGVEDADNFDKIYQSDLCGQVGTFGYNRSYIDAANVYTAEEAETIEAVGFYALGENTSYKISVVPDYSNTKDLIQPVEVASGTVDNKGYYTIRLDQKLEVAAKHKFAIVIEIETPDCIRPMAIEYQADDLGTEVDLSDGCGYLSKNGMDWESVEENYDANLCLKAYTNKVK